MPAFKHRGVMLDPARLLEKRSYYYDLLPWLKEWGYNVLHLHFTDDQGCPFVFPSHPELATPGAFTVDEMKDFIKAAKKQRITVIPELESLGHTQFITRVPKYRHLGGRKGKHSGFNSLHPKKKEVRLVLKDLLRDIAEVFPSDIIHAGLDEVDMSAIPEFKKLSRADQWKAFAPHAAWVHEEIRQLGKRPAMWGDHMLHSPKMAKRFKQDVLIFDWHYNAPLGDQSLRFFLDRGFEVWGCPASMRHYEKILPTINPQFQNLRDFSANGLALKRQGCTGMVNTVWCPWRYLSGVMDLPMAFGGHLFDAQEESPTFITDFCVSFYGLKKADARACGELMWQLHAVAPERPEYCRLIQQPQDLTREDRRRFGVMTVTAGQVARHLKPLVKKAKRNGDRLNDYVLSARIMQVVGRFGKSGGKKAAVGNIGPLLKACDKSWQSTKDEPWDTFEYPYTGTEWLLPTLKSLPMLGK